MDSNGLSPVPGVIRLRDDRKDRWKVAPQSAAQEKKENVESQIAFYPLKAEDDETRKDEPRDDRFLIAQAETSRPPNSMLMP